jgi:NADPH:quinone reductase-like Zn-dependent oxidoreductase
MKAIVYTKYGSPDVLHLEKVEKPAPGDDEVLVKIHAAAANPLDWHFMRAKPFFMRLISGLLKPKNKILGADIAGQVEGLAQTLNSLRQVMRSTVTYPEVVLPSMCVSLKIN